MSNGGRLEETRRQLVEQRLEGVVVVLVDDDDVDVGLLQLVGGADPGEASAENEDPRSLTAGRVRHDTRPTGYSVPRSRSSPLGAPGAPPGLEWITTMS